MKKCHICDNPKVEELETAKFPDSVLEAYYCKPGGGCRVAAQQKMHLTGVRLSPIERDWDNPEDDEAWRICQNRPPVEMAKKELERGAIYLVMKERLEFERKGGQHRMHLTAFSVGVLAFLAGFGVCWLAFVR